MIKRILEHDTMMNRVAYSFQSMLGGSIGQFTYLRKLDQQIGSLGEMAEISKG